VSTDDEKPNWPMIVVLSVAVLGAPVVGLGNMSGCWFISPYPRDLASG
jgi:hypothetical protein